MRGADFSVSDVDVVIEDFPRLKVDCKAYARFAHHSLMDEVREKYCKTDGDVPVLVTKGSRQVSANVTIPLEHYAYLLEVLRVTMGRANLEPRSNHEGAGPPSPGEGEGGSGGA